MSYPTSFETLRLRLRLTGIEDAAFIRKLVNSPDWLKYIGSRNVYSLSDAEQYIKSKMLAQLDHRDFGNYTIIRKSDGEKLGTCGLYDRTDLEGVDLGFALLASYFKKGYAYEAASCIQKAAFEVFDCSALNAITTVENINSQNLIKKLGFSFKKIISFGKEKEKMMLFGLSQKEYLQINKKNI